MLEDVYELAQICGENSKLAIVIAHHKSRRMLITNCAARLYDAVIPTTSSGEMVMKLLRESIRLHAEHGHEGMRFCARLIVLGSFLTQVPRPLRLTTLAFDVVQVWLDEYLTRCLCACAFKIKLDDCLALAALVRPILSSSSLLRLSPVELCRLCILLVSSFRYCFAQLPSLPCLLPVLGPSPNHSLLVQGLLLDIPFIPHAFDVEQLQGRDPISIAFFECAIEPSERTSRSPNNFPSF